MTSHLIAQIERALNTEITDQRSLPVGFGLRGFRLSLADGREAAVKASVKGDNANLAVEAFMLRELRAKSNLPVPEVYYSGDGLLIMEWLLSGSSITPQVQHHAAELLADLHAQPFDTFGYSQDTLIGPLHQPNPQSDDWVTFFRDHRLMYMAQQANEEKRLPNSLLARIERLAERIDQHIQPPAHPSLLHGDLWGGNVIARDNRITGFIDPAIYCGHPEIELAFTTLFSTFGKPFFDAYSALSPIEQGFFEERLDLYNLYPTLVHLRLFGDSYLPPIDNTLRKVGL
jgi:fructosamine-3-kinase